MCVGNVPVHLLGHGLIDDRQQQWNLFGDRADDQGHPQDERVLAGDHGDRIEPSSLERLTNLALVRFEQALDRGA